MRRIFKVIKDRSLSADKVAGLLGICFHARRTGDGQKGERRRGVRESVGCSDKPPAAGGHPRAP